MECQVNKDQHLRHLFAFNQGRKAADFYSGDFCQRGIENLVERWVEVVNNNGEYIIDQLIVIFHQTF